MAPSFLVGGRRSPSGSLTYRIPYRLARRGPKARERERERERAEGPKNAVRGGPRGILLEEVRFSRSKIFPPKGAIFAKNRKTRSEKKFRPLAFAIDFELCSHPRNAPVLVPYTVLTLSHSIGLGRKRKIFTYSGRFLHHPIANAMRRARDSGLTILYPRFRFSNPDVSLHPGPEIFGFRV